jgi:transcriptional regulator with XRE-family HTH domain
MEEGQKSTIRSRELGDELRHAMEVAHLSGKLAARRLGWSETKVSRLLTGRQSPIRESDVASLLTLCDVRGEDKERLLDLAREANQHNWLQQHIAELPEQLRTLISHENQASLIYQFDLSRIPGLLQTREYAQALIGRIATIPSDNVEALVDARMSRQSLFSRDDHPDFAYFIHEMALWVPVGGPAVMSHQLHHLLQLGVRRYITIRVVPLSLGAFPAMDNSCRLVEFNEMKPVVYVDVQTAGNFFEDAATVVGYRKVFGALADCSLSEGDSRDLIARLAVDLYGGGEDHNAGS